MTVDQKSEKSDSASHDVPPPLPTSEPPMDENSPTTVREDVTKCEFVDDHQNGREYINVLLDLAPEKVYNLLFNHETFMNKILNEQKCNEIIAGQWQQNPVTKELTRKVTFTATLPPGLIGPPTSNITEIQTVAVLKPNELYIVNKEITNAGIPYADNFKLTNHTCITKEITGEKVQTRLKQYGQVIFKKSTVFFVRNMIEKNALAGAENVALDIQASLIAESKGQVTRKRKRHNGRDIPRKSAESSKKLSQDKGQTGSLWIILVLLILAGLMNTYLYHRLNQLEQKRFMQLMKSGHIIRSPANTEEEQIRNLFMEEESHYNTQLSMWQAMIDETVTALDKVENSFQAIKNSALLLQKRSIPLLEKSESVEMDTIEHLEHKELHDLSHQPL